MTQEQFNTVTGDAWRAAAAEARRRFGVEMCDNQVEKALMWNERAKRYDKNAYIAEGGPQR